MSINPLKILREIAFERLAGTEGERKAADILMSYLDKLNVSVKMEEFEIVAFKPGKGHLVVDNKSVEVIPFGLNESCQVRGEMVYLENLEILTHRKKAYKGKIILANGYSRNCVEHLKQQEVAAIIIIGSPNRQASSLSHRQQTYKDGYTHSATISYEDALPLLKKVNRVAELTIEQEVFVGKARNIVVDIRGSGSESNLTYLVGHYDSVANTQGATDNAGGAVSLLKLSEHFSVHRPLRDLRVVFFSGEELGLLGSQHHVVSHQKEISERAGLVINIDVSGDTIAKTKAIITGSKELLGYSQGILREKGYYVAHNLDIYSSDQMPFVRVEIPAISFARVGGRGSFYIHTKDDKARHVTAEGLKIPIESSKILLQRILNSKIYPVNKDIDSSLRDTIEKYLWNLNYQEPKIEWDPKFKK